jgi:hypothetical protein
MALVLVRLLELYAVVGVVFAVPFAWRLAARIDPVAASGTPGFRLLILPGAAALWPWLLVRVLRARPSMERAP